VKQWLILIILLNVIACAQSDNERILTVKVKAQPLIIDVPASGELEAKQSTPISVPAGIFEPQQLSWMVEENAFVKKGDVVARLDDTKYRYERQQKALEKNQIKLDEGVKSDELQRDKSDLTSDKSLIKEELDIAEAYTIDDVRLYSKNETIDKMKNKDYLEAKLSNNEWKFDRYENKAKTEMELLALKQQEVATKITMYQTSLDKMEVTAPHDGVFVLTKNWRGEKTQIGQMLFPGHKFASLPDLSELQAKLYVLENESINIKQGQPVEITLDASPNRRLKGTITAIEPVAKVKDRENPVKYFQMTATLEKTDSDVMRVGEQIKARVIISKTDNAIAIPNIAINKGLDNHFVYLLKGGEFIKQDVAIKQRGASLSWIEQGLSEGDEIALSFQSLEKQR